MRFQFNEREYKLRFHPTADKHGRENGMSVTLESADGTLIGAGIARKHKLDPVNRVVGRLVALRSLNNNPKVKEQTSREFRKAMWQHVLGSGLRMPVK